MTNTADPSIAITDRPPPEFVALPVDRPTSPASRRMELTLYAIPLCLTPKFRACLCGGDGCCLRAHRSATSLGACTIVPSRIKRLAAHFAFTVWELSLRPHFGDLPNPPSSSLRLRSLQVLHKLCKFSSWKNFSGYNRAGKMWSVQSASLPTAPWTPGGKPAHHGFRANRNFESLRQRIV